MKPKLIALTGFAKAGKSTVANILTTNHNFVVLKFAAPLKDMLRAFGLSEDEIEGDLKHLPCAKLCGRTPRYAMQTLGTEWGRRLIGEDLWVEAFRRQCQELLNEGFNVVCDDLRFLNEHKVIQDLGGTTVRVLRLEGEIGCESAHESETQQLQIPIDLYIKNDSTIEVLHQYVEELLTIMEATANG